MAHTLYRRAASIYLMTIALGAAGCMAERPQVAALPAAAVPMPLLVETTCSGCHAVTAGVLSPVAAAPTFSELANSPGLTEATLADFLANSHNYPDLMDVELDEAEAREIARYVLSLKSADHGKSAL